MADPQPGPAQHGPPEDAATTPGSTPRRHWVLISLGVLTLALLGVTAWFGLSARSAYAELTAARDDLLSARSGLGATDLAAASAGLESAAGHASTAADQVDSPLWSVAAAVPILGATPAAVQSVATALDQALTGLAPAAATLQVAGPRHPHHRQGPHRPGHPAGRRPSRPDRPGGRRPGPGHPR